MNSIRRLAEKLARGRILKRHIKVRNNSMPIYVSPDAQLKYLKRGSSAFDKDLIEIAEKFLEETSVVWDIGANVGVFTFGAAAIARRGTVLSVEADIWLADLLGRTRKLREYQDSDIRILPVAISNKNSVAVFQIANRGRASNALEEAGGNSQMGGVREKKFTPSLTLDTVLDTMPHPDFVKIDVEGAEALVLEGATRVLSEIRPLIYLEVGAGNKERVKQCMKEHSYLMFSPGGVG